MILYNKKYKYHARLIWIKPRGTYILIRMKDDQGHYFKQIYEDFDKFRDEWCII